MGKIGTALLEATNDDMGDESGEVTSAARLVRNLIDRDSEMETGDALKLGWALHDLESWIGVLNTFTGDLSVIAEELDTLTARLAKVSAKANKPRVIKIVVR